MAARIVPAFCVFLAASLAAAQPPLDNRWLEYVKDNNALGGGLTPTSISSTDDEPDFAWGDLDNDGLVDLVVVRKQPFTTVGKRTNLLLMNVGGVLFDQTSTYATQSDVAGDQGFLTPTNDRDAVVVDVDNDGWLDVVTATTLSDGDPKEIGHPRVYRNLGGTPWLGLRYEAARIPQLFQSNGNPQNPRFNTVDAGDVTGDGFVDLYFVDHDSSGVGSGTIQGPGQDMNDRLLVNDGTGFFNDESQARMTWLMLVSSYGIDGSIADFNGDGHLDVMKNTTLASPQTVSIAYNDSTNPGHFVKHQIVYAAFPYSADSGDVNNDGRIDCAVGDGHDDAYRYNLGNQLDGTVNWGVAKTYGAAGECESGGCTDDGFSGPVRIEDIDNDGWRDIIYADVDADLPGFNRRLHIYHNPGGVIGSQITLHEEQEQTADLVGWKSAVGLTEPRLRGTYDVAVLDLDGDGDKDLILGRSAGTEVWKNVQVCASNLGSQGPGTATLSFCGDGMRLGGVNSLELTGAPANATAFLFVSTPGGVDVPFGAGELVSFTNAIPSVLPLLTDPNGDASLTILGKGGGPASLITQGVIPDAQQPGGFAITNALQVNLPP